MPAIEVSHLTKAFRTYKKELLEKPNATPDDKLLAALAPDLDPSTLSLPTRTRITPIGSLAAGEASLSLTHAGEPVELPEKLGFEHQSGDDRGLPTPPVDDRP